MSVGTEPGFLGVARTGRSAPAAMASQNLRLPTNVSSERLGNRKAMLEGFDDVKREVDASGTMNGLDAFTSRAFDMVTSGAVRKALDLTNESASTRERYKGVEQFLTARRLVEAGTGCVTLSIGGWDTHGQNFVSAEEAAKPQVQIAASPT